MAQVNVDAKSAIDFGGKSLAALGAFLLADSIFLPDVSVTPGFIAPLVGWIVCGGAAVVAWRLVKP